MIKKNWKLIVFAVLSPIILSQIIRLPFGKWTIGDEESWIGFLGSYIGALISGLITLFVFVKTIEYYREADQAEKEKQKEQNRMSIMPYLKVKGGSEEPSDTFNFYFGKTQSESSCQFEALFEIENIGLGSAINISIESDNTINWGGVRGVALAVGHKAVFKISLDNIHTNTGFMIDIFELTYTDLLENKYTQKMQFAAHSAEKDVSNWMQVIEVLPPIHQNQIKMHNHIR